jgi:hypothetical protein
MAFGGVYCRVWGCSAAERTRGTEWSDGIHNVLSGVTHIREARKGHPRVVIGHQLMGFEVQPLLLEGECLVFLHDESELKIGLRSRNMT